MCALLEDPDDEGDDRQYFSRLARYSRGCPAFQHEDICEDPAHCAATGRCWRLAAEDTAMEYPRMYEEQ